MLMVCFGKYMLFVYLLMPKYSQKYLMPHGTVTQIQDYWNVGLMVQFHQVI